jgi:integrase/recombinase XerD
VAVFAKVPASSFAVKMNIYKALISFGAYLVENGRLTQDYVDSIRKLKPKRQRDPRRTHLGPADLERMFDIILTRRYPVFYNQTLAAMVACMAYAGLRVSEVCSLRQEHVDLEARILHVLHGKGGKSRKVGISVPLLAYLQSYEAYRIKGDFYFLSANGKPFDRHRVGRKVKRISRRLGVDITCHGLRRTFATLAANRGHSVNSIRIALGHSELETTLAYLRTSETEVIEAMKEW